MVRRWKLAALLLLTMVALAGCSTDPTQNPIDRVGFWDKYFVWPLSEFMNWVADSAWGEYGIAILVVTIIIRLLILPLTIKQYRSSRAMQALQPEMKKIREKYKDNTQKQQEEMMKLYQQHGVNPLAGCFPLLVQMPVLLALFHAISRNPEIREHTFLWMQLGEKDHLFILPVLAALTTFIQQKMMSSTQSQVPSQMQALMYIFPVLIFVMSMSFASALPLYWVYSNLFTIVQTYFIYGLYKGSQKKGGLSK